MLRKFLADRWNHIAPNDGICVLAEGEDTPPPPTGCFRPTRLSDLYMSGQAEPDPLDIDPNPDPTIPEAMLLDHAPPGPVAPEPEDTGTAVLKWVAGLVAGALVIEGARRVGSYIAKHPAVVSKPT